MRGALEPGPNEFDYSEFDASEVIFDNDSQ